MFASILRNTIVYSNINQNPTDIQREKKLSSANKTMAVSFLRHWAPNRI